MINYGDRYGGRRKRETKECDVREEEERSREREREERAGR